MLRSRLPSFAGLTLVLGMLVAGWLWHRQTARNTPSPETGKQASSGTGSNRAKPRSQPPLAAQTDELRRALASVLDAVDHSQRTALLSELRRILEQASAAERQRYLGEFLASRRDADLGGKFTVGPEGGLAASPTLRVWLLNEQARLDPAGAAALGRQVLESMDSPDEWAIALRCVGVGDPSAAGRVLMKEKTLALLGHEPWQQQPTSGYLNAFDVAVHLKDQEFAPVLSGLLRQTNQQALAHAAFLALDRLAMGAPVGYLRELQANPDWLAGRESTRAGIFARADVTDSAQRLIVESYLLDSRRGAEELNAFAGTFPNASLFLSHNLLTRQSTYDGAMLLRRDTATLGVVRQWLADPRFAPLQGPLRTIDVRLQEYLRQAQR